MSSCNLPKQLVPGPENPLLQTQEKEPSVFMHVAFWWQLWAPSIHSSISASAQTNLGSNYCNKPSSFNIFTGRNFSASSCTTHTAKQALESKWLYMGSNVLIARFLSQSIPKWKCEIHKIKHKTCNRLIFVYLSRTSHFQWIQCYRHMRKTLLYPCMLHDCHMLPNFPHILADLERNSIL